MRGADGMQESLFTVTKLDDFVPSDHPLCSTRRLNGLFNTIYAKTGRTALNPGYA